MRVAVAMLAGVVLAATALIGQYPASAQDPLDRVNPIIVIYQENWSFDALYGKFPGVNGLANADPVAIRQMDKSDQPYSTLPQPINRRLTPPAPGPRFPTDLPNEPFNQAGFIQPTEIPGSPIHEVLPRATPDQWWETEQVRAWTDVGGLAMSYYDATNWPMGRMAQQFTLADNFFHAAFGGSFLNHFWFICACSHVWRDAPADQRAQLDANGLLTRDCHVTPDGYVVNTSFTVKRASQLPYDENGGRWDHVVRAIVG